MKNHCIQFRVHRLSSRPQITKGHFGGCWLMNSKTLLFLLAAAVSFWNNSALAQDNRTNAREDTTDSWQEVRQKDTIEAYEEFLAGYFGHLPAERRLRELRYQRALQTGQLKDWIAFYNFYGLVRFPGDDRDVQAMKVAAEHHLKHALHEELLRTPSVELCQKYRDLPRSGLTEHKCYCLGQDEEFERARTSNGRFPYALYLAKCPDGRYVREANDRLTLLQDPERCASISDVGDRRACYSTYDYFVKDLDDGSFLNRVAEAFGLPREYPWVKSRVSPREEAGLTPEQVAHKDGLIESYMTSMRTGFFQEAERARVQLQEYAVYLSDQDFYRVADKIYTNADAQVQLEFIFFPTFFKKVYSAVVRTLGDEYSHFEWPLGLYDLEQGGRRYHVAVMTLSDPQRFILISDNAKVLHVVGDSGGVGTLRSMCDPYAVFGPKRFAKGQVLSVNECHNCSSSQFYVIRNDKLVEVRLLGKDGASSPFYFKAGCSRAGIGIECEFEDGSVGPESIACNRYESATEQGKDGYRRWRTKYAWDEDTVAFRVSEHTTTFEPFD